MAGFFKKIFSFGKKEVVEERIVRNGNIWTAAGVSAGTDLALAFIASEAGEDVAGQVQFFAEYYPSPTRYGRAHLDDHWATIRTG